MDLSGRAPIKLCGAGTPIRFDITVSVQIFLSDYLVTLIFFCVENVLRKINERKINKLPENKIYIYHLFSN